MSSLYKVFFGLTLLQAGSSFSQGKIIMNGGATMNMNNSVYVITKDVSLANPSAINVNNSTLKVAGTISSNDNIDLQAGTLEMNGASSQTIPAAAFKVNKIKNLIISNDVNLAGQDSITNVLSFGAVDGKTFSTGGFLTLKSTAAGTAIVADLTNSDVNSGNQVLGNVTAERYLSSIKKWRFLTVPTNSTRTVKAEWQEGSAAPNDNLVGGYGTQITGPGGTAAGFDLYTVSPSVKTYDATTNSWKTIPNTNSYLVNTTTNNTIAYMVFVRGDRTATSLSSPVTPTTLRTTGVIKQGDQSPVTIAAPATAFTSVGNPFPSYIDLRKLTPAPNFGTKIYVWDPLATIGSAYGLGAYQTLTFNGSDFTVTPGGGSYGPPYNQDPNRIESGSAFFVGGNASPYSITFKEDVKPSGNFVIAAPIRRQEYLQANLFLNNNGTVSLMDGIKADVDVSFANTLDDLDAYKITSSSENVSLKRGGKLLSVERHHTIAASDTFFLNVTNLKAQSYQWQLNIENMDHPGVNGYIEDHFVHTSTALDLNGTNIIDFIVNSAPASYAPDRFAVVFAQPKVLATTFTDLKAYRQNTHIIVDWNVENEIDMKQYDVEKSLDGINFTNMNTTMAKNANKSSYSWTDANAQAGYNYYRIESTNAVGKIEYSKVVKVFVEKERSKISVYPNPIVNGIINLQLTNQPEGTYGVRLLNGIGQVIVSKQVEHANGSSSEKIKLNKNSARGIYQLEITKPTGDKVTINVIN